MPIDNFGAARRRLVLGLGFAVAASGAYADTWPSKPIRLIVPYAAGGFSDQAARAIGKALSDDLKQPVVIENRGGGGGRIGAEAVTRMAPDGYNLLLTTNGTHTYMAVTEKSLSYDPIKDFTPISEIASYGLLMVVNPSVPARNVKEFIAYAKANPGKISYASSGPGSGLHFAGEVFKSMTGVEMTHVPYKGSGPGLLDVIGNVCQVIFAGEAKPHIDAGKVRLLGTTSARRDPRWPDMPTVGEGGLPGYDLTYWVGLFGPKGLPPEVSSRLSLAVRNILKDEALQKQFTSMGMVAVGSSPDQLVEQIRTETAKLRTVAVSSGIVTP
ncbi:MAG TPA: tripartite tricarboxylate transporter substrate binding protein [Ramlibacter sp.]|jgi:tripartite-type tricarboxylate transporter receptor subunit TctC